MTLGGFNLFSFWLVLVLLLAAMSTAAPLPGQARKACDTNGECHELICDSNDVCHIEITQQEGFIGGSNNRLMQEEVYGFERLSGDPHRVLQSCPFSDCGSTLSQTPPSMIINVGLKFTCPTSCNGRCFDLFDEGCSNPVAIKSIDFRLLAPAGTQTINVNLFLLCSCGQANTLFTKNLAADLSFSVDNVADGFVSATLPSPLSGKAVYVEYCYDGTNSFGGGGSNSEDCTEAFLRCPDFDPQRYDTIASSHLDLLLDLNVRDCGTAQDDYDTCVLDTGSSAACSAEFAILTTLCGPTCPNTYDCLTDDIDECNYQANLCDPNDPSLGYNYCFMHQEDHYHQKCFATLSDAIALDAQSDYQFEGCGCCKDIPRLQTDGKSYNLKSSKAVACPAGDVIRNRALSSDKEKGSSKQGRRLRL